jgi:hypothetical protein
LLGVKEDLKQEYQEESKENGPSQSDLQKTQDELLGAGIEIFRLKNEQVVDFCFDQVNMDTMAIGI